MLTRFKTRLATLSKPLRWTAGLAAAFVLLSIANTTAPYRVTYNGSASLPTGLYLVHLTDELPARGELAVFTYQSPIWAQDRRYARDGDLFIKHLAGLPGDQVATHGRHTWLVLADGVEQDLGFNLLRDSRDRPMVSVDFGASTVIPAGSYFMSSTWNPKSLDSRYLGLIPRERIAGVATPLWVNKTVPADDLAALAQEQEPQS